MPSINDNFADAIEVTIATDGGTYTSDSLDTSGNTTESGEPHVTASSNCSAWWSYTPANSGTATFDTRASTSNGGSTDNFMAIWTGTNFADMVLVASNDDSGGSGKALIEDMPVTGGTTYWPQIGGFGFATMNLVLEVTGPATTGGGGTPPSEGSGTGTVAWAGSGVGERSPKATGSGTLTWAGSGTGQRTPKASGTGAVAYTGSGLGSAPALDQQGGSGSGTWAFAGTGTGHRAPVATGAGTLAYAGAGTGTTSRSGTGTGLLTFTGTGTGRSAAATVVTVGAPVAHRYTTATPRARHLSGTPLPPRYTRRT